MVMLWEAMASHHVTGRKWPLYAVVNIEGEEDLEEAHGQGRIATDRGGKKRTDFGAIDGRVTARVKLGHDKRTGTERASERRSGTMIAYY